MKLVHANYDFTFDFAESQQYEWIVESQKEFRKIILDMRKNDSDFVLSNDDKILKWGKEVELIEEPFSIELEEKRIISKMYVEMKEIAESEEEYLNTQNIISMMKSFFLRLEEKSSFDISMTDEIDFTQMIKAMGITIDMSQENYLERICEYCRILFEILNLKLMIFLNLRSFLTDEEMDLLIEMAVVREWNLLLLESCERSILKKTKRVILDKDLCEVF